MRVDRHGVRIEYDVAGGRATCGAAARLSGQWAIVRHQVPALSDVGFRVIVPDLRGYGRSGKRADVAGYAMSQLVGDVAGVLDQVGMERTHVVGHDWGAGLAGAALAVGLPHRVDHLAVLSVGIRRRSRMPVCRSGRSRGTCCCFSSSVSRIASSPRTG
jgi:pimeloyl-ACP methyl ester carboxylesterase